MLLFSGEVIDFAYLTQHLLGNLEQTPLVLLLLRQALPHSEAGAAKRGEQVSVEESESASQSQRCKQHLERVSTNSFRAVLKEMQETGCCAP